MRAAHRALTRHHVPLAVFRLQTRLISWRFQRRVKSRVRQASFRLDETIEQDPR